MSNIPKISLVASIACLGLIDNKLVKTHINNLVINNGIGGPNRWVIKTNNSKG